MRDDLKTLDRGLRVLSELARSREPLGPRELERRLGIARSAVQRGLTTLKAHGFVRQDPISKSYELGYAARALGEAGAAKEQLIRASRDRMLRLCALADETVCLSIREGDSRVAIYQAETERPLRYSIKIGQRYPLCVGAAGKVLVASLPKSDLARLRADFEAARVDTGLKSWRDFERSLADVAARGYAVTYGEAVPEAVGIAAPILESAGRVIGCIGVYGPEFRLPRTRVEELIPRVQEAARAISRALGAKSRLRKSSTETQASSKEIRV